MKFFFCVLPSFRDCVRWDAYMIIMFLRTEVKVSQCINRTYLVFPVSVEDVV